MNKLESMVLFQNREEAVEQLIKELPDKVFSSENTIVLGVSVGGAYYK